MFNLFGFKKKTVGPELPPLVYGNTREYWRARFEREESFYRRLVDNAEEELSCVHRRDWWANYPGVSSTVSRNLSSGLNLAYAGEWEMACRLIRGRCLPYQFVLDSPEFTERLRGEHSNLADHALGELWQALGVARSIVDETLDRASLEKSIVHYMLYLRSPTDDVYDEEWASSKREFTGIYVGLLGLILGDFEGAGRRWQDIPKARIHPEYRKRLEGLALAPRDDIVRKAFLEHFEHVCDMKARSDKWKRPQGCQESSYRYLCGVLAERITADWNGVPDWREVCNRIAAL